MTKTSIANLAMKALAAGIAATLLTLTSPVSAGACEQPHNPTSSPTPSPSVSQIAASTDIVRVTQTEPGSLFGLLQWPSVAGATQYYIYKTGTIRPYWRLFWIAPSRMTALEVVDKPGSIAVYRVVAIVNGREVAVGRFNYRPSR